MNEQQVHEAIEQMLAHCDLMMDNYQSVSARSTLRTLGYKGEDVEQVLKFIFDGGFNYCLDPRYHQGKENVVADVCVWGPDQLASRLHSLSNYRARTRVRRWSEVKS